MKKLGGGGVVTGAVVQYQVRWVLCFAGIKWHFSYHTTIIQRLFGAPPLKTKVHSQLQSPSIPSNHPPNETRYIHTNLRAFETNGWRKSQARIIWTKGKGKEKKRHWVCVCVTVLFYPFHANAIVWLAYSKNYLLRLKSLATCNLMNYIYTPTNDGTWLPRKGQNVLQYKL